MIRARFVGVTAIALGAVLASAATAQNPAFNGGFSRDLRGWSKETVPVAWSDRDGDGLANSGSALVVQNGRAMNGEGILQCLYGFTFTPGTLMTVGARVHLPTGQAATGWAAVGLNWYAKPGCKEDLSVGGPRAQVMTPNGGFEWTSTDFTVPDGAVSAELVVYVTKFEEDETLLAYFDDVHVRNGADARTLPAIYVPAAAHVFGAAGTAWRTDAVLQNPTSSPVWLEIDLLARDVANVTPAVHHVLAAPGQAVSYPDVVKEKFAYDGAVALRVIPESGTVVVGSRTYNLTSGGTYGQYIPGIPEGEATTSERTARLIKLSQSTNPASGYRTNIGLVSAVGMIIEVKIELYTSQGALVGTKNLTVPPFGFVQVDGIYTEFTSDDVWDGFAVLSTSTVGGRFIAYASVVDNRTGDAICVQPSPI